MAEATRHRRSGGVAGESRLALVTGGTAGIGAATAGQLVAAGLDVVIVGRDPERGARTAAAISDEMAATRQGAVAAGARPSVSFVQADLSQQDEVRRLADCIAADHGQLDVLVNNVAAHSGERRETVDGIELTLATGFVNVFLLTHLLVPLLATAADGRIVNVTAGGHRMTRIDWDDLQGRRRYQPFAQYNRTKLLALAASLVWARRLAPSGVMVGNADPGFADTAMARTAVPRPLLSLYRLVGLQRPPVEAARSSVHLATAPRLPGGSGRYVVGDGRDRRPSSAARDRALQVRAWRAATELANLPELNRPVEEPGWVV